jgi:hypothetical protein
MRTSIPALILVACMAHAADDSYPTTISVNTRIGVAHACYVEGALLTNAHVVDFRRSNEIGQKSPAQTCVRYSTPDGTEGRACSYWVSQSDDLALLVDHGLRGPSAVRAERAPEPGDDVWWVEYDFGRRDDAFKPRLRKSEVLRVVFGNLILKEEATSGASGGCVYDEKGAVVGLLSWGMTMQSGDEVTGVVGLWGRWFDDVKLRQAEHEEEGK